MPGLLGAVTLYILSRASYFQLVYKENGVKDGPLVFLMYYLVLLGIPIFLAVTLISPKINAVLSNPESTIAV